MDSYNRANYSREQDTSQQSPDKAASPLLTHIAPSSLGTPERSTRSSAGCKALTIHHYSCSLVREYLPPNWTL